ncbi:MAG: hypothetical protein HKN76_16110 [Saprospiraceae bacterium]|nr:hypothetical protein [Saprospiraceae bacterium]
MTLRISFILCLTLLWQSLISQSSELYIVDLLQVADKYEATNGRYLSHFNAGGYTNQPSFADPYTLLISVGMQDTPLATDLYELNLRTRRKTRITRTTEREYSPVISQLDPKYISCVLVEPENDNKQVIWQYPYDRSNGGRPLLSGTGQVGYFAELKDAWIAVFEVGSPNKLWLYNEESGEKKFITANVGRSLQRSGDGSLVYVHKFSDDYWFLKKLNLEDLRSEIIKKTITGAEDFVLLADDSIIMGSQSKLYHLDPNGGVTWSEIADLSDMGIKNITRLAFNGINQLAIVDQRE